MDLLAVFQEKTRSSLFTLIQTEFSQIISKAIDERGRYVAAANVVKAVDKIVKICGFGMRVLAGVGISLNRNLVLDFKF